MLAVEREAERLGTVTPPMPAVHELFYEEVTRSCALAGATLTVADVRPLLDRDVVAPGRSLADNVMVADYGHAARFVRSSPPPRRRTVFLSLEEIASLHALATRRSLAARPGRWRERTAAPFPSGMVPPPAWLVPREIAAYVERFASGPRDRLGRVAWIADAHERLLRIHPFDTANGRVTRLVTNLLLRRTGLPPFVVRRRDAARYVAALRRADSRDPWPLARVVARSLLESFGGLLAGAEGADPLQPLARFAVGSERAALYKAAQRGRLQTVRREGALLTKRAWIDAYRNARPRVAASEEPHDGDDPRNARPR
jgi:hypothetical protein